MPRQEGVEERPETSFPTPKLEPFVPRLQRQLTFYLREVSLNINISTPPTVSKTYVLPFLHSPRNQLYHSTPQCNLKPQRA